MTQNPFSIRMIPWVILAANLNMVGSAQTSSQPNSSERQKMAERHKQIAQIHTKMAACLESNRPFSQCRQEIEDSCTSMFGAKCNMPRSGRGAGMGSGSCWKWDLDPDKDTNSAPQGTKKTK